MLWAGARIPVVRQLLARPDLPTPIVVGAVDAGSNSVHLLVARIADHTLTTLADESAFLGLGDRVRRDGFLGAATRTALVEALVRFGKTAAEHGTTLIAFVGTEPCRRAADAARVVREIEDATGVPLAVLTHEEEALLTLIGATGGVPPADRLVVVDVGGGSSQIVTSAPGGSPSALGLEVGSARLTGTFAEHDPATPDEVDTMRSVVAEGVAELPPGQADTIIAVGGTASNLSKVVRARVIERAALDGALARLLAQPAEASAAEFGIRPQRATLLPAGIVIFEAMLDHYGARELQVLEEGIREGLALALARSGRDWRNRLKDLVRGWRTMTSPRELESEPGDGPPQ